jgi:hypothetical protein
MYRDIYFSVNTKYALRPISSKLANNNSYIYKPNRKLLPLSYINGDMIQAFKKVFQQNGEYDAAFLYVKLQNDIYNAFQQWYAEEGIRPPYPHEKIKISWIDGDNIVCHRAFKYLLYPSLLIRHIDTCKRYFNITQNSDIESIFINLSANALNAMRVNDAWLLESDNPKDAQSAIRWTIRHAFDINVYYRGDSVGSSGVTDPDISLEKLISVIGVESVKSFRAMLIKNSTRFSKTPEDIAEVVIRQMLIDNRYYNISCHLKIKDLRGIIKEFNLRWFNNTDVEVCEFDGLSRRLTEILIGKPKKIFSEDTLKRHFALIQKFKADDFSYERFFAKITALADSGEDLIERFAIQSFISIGKLLTQHRPVHYKRSRLLGITGEISGIYELLYRHDTSLANVRIGKVKAINKLIRKNHTDIIVKEFDAVSDNTVFEFKFHLTLKELYEQVVGLKKAKMPHFKVLTMPEFLHIKNLVYFGENEGGNVMKAVLDYVQKHALFNRVTMSWSGGISVKFDIESFRDFILDKQTLKYAANENRLMPAKDFFNAEKIRNADEFLSKKISQIQRDEHFDVIIGISNPGREDMERAKSMIDNPNYIRCSDILSYEKPVKLLWINETIIHRAA